MKTSTSMLALCIIMAVTCVHSQTNQDVTYVASPSFCCNTQQGPRVQFTPIESEEISEESPFYEVIGTENSFTKGLDNVCYTFFPIDDKAYLRINSMTYSNGTVLIQKYIVQSLEGLSGVARLQGLSTPSGASTIIVEEAFLGNACPGVKAYYRKYLAGSCNVLKDEIGDGSDFRHGDANTRCISDYCLSKVLSILNSQNFTGSKFVKYPFTLNSNCVTQIYGMSCVNADKVRPQDSISLTDTRSSCQTLFY